MKTLIPGPNPLNFCPKCQNPLARGYTSNEEVGYACLRCQVIYDVKSLKRVYDTRPRDVPDLEGMFAEEWYVRHLDKEPWQYQRQYKPFEDRNYRLDFAWPDQKVVLEIQGMAHRIKKRFNDDMLRHDLLVLAGWRVLYATGKMLREDIDDVCNMVEVALGLLKEE